MSTLVIDKIIHSENVHHAQDIVMREFQKWRDIYEEDNYYKIIERAVEELQRVMWLYDRGDVYECSMLYVKNWQSRHVANVHSIFNFTTKKNLFWIKVPDVDYVYYDGEWHEV